MQAGTKRCYRSLSTSCGGFRPGSLSYDLQSASAPTVSISCKPGACTVPRRTYYTLIMADPDAPSRENPIRRNIWHWGVINAPNGRISQGKRICPTVLAKCGAHALAMQ